VSVFRPICARTELLRLGCRGFRRAPVKTRRQHTPILPIPGEIGTGQPPYWPEGVKSTLRDCLRGAVWPWASILEEE